MSAPMTEETGQKILKALERIAGKMETPKVVVTVDGAFDERDIERFRHGARCTGRNAMRFIPWSSM